MAETDLITAQLTPAQRDAIFDQIAVAFEFASDLPWMLAHGAENVCDRAYARELIAQLAVAVRILDQLGWQPKGNRDGYVLEVDAEVVRFVGDIERDSLAALEDGRQGLLDSSHEMRELARARIDRELDTLGAVRLVRAVFGAPTPPVAAPPTVVRRAAAR